MVLAGPQPSDQNLMFAWAELDWLERHATATRVQPLEPDHDLAGDPGERDPIEKYETV